MCPLNGKFEMTKRALVIGSAFSLLAALPLHSQTCGNPAGTAGKGQTTMGISGAYQVHEDGQQKMVSNRIFLKAMFGLAPWLDVYGLAGTTQVGMKTVQAGIPEFKDKYRFGYGAGFNFLLNPSAPRTKRPGRGSTASSAPARIGFWGGGNVIRYPAEAVFDVSNGTVGHEYRMKYDCREITGHAGIVIPYRTLKIYAGGVGWAVQRLETKKEYLLGISTEPVFKGGAKATYQSGLWTGGLFGIQVDLPQNYSLTVEAIGFNKADYQIMVGISQTGIRKW
jgi:hypothetical protein